MSVSTLLVVGLVVYFLFGGFGWRRGYYGGGPYIGLGGFLALVLAILFLTGRLHQRGRPPRWASARLRRKHHGT